MVYLRKLGFRQKNLPKVGSKAVDEKSFDAIGPSVGRKKNCVGLFRDLA